MDPSILLGAQGVTIPNPIAQAGQALTLGDLVQRNRLGALNLQAQQEANAAVPELANRLAQGERPEQVFADIAQKYPTAYPKLLQDWKAQQLTQSQINKENAAAASSQMDVKAKGVGIVGNMANAIATQSGPVTSMQAQQLLQQAKFVGTPDQILSSAPNDPDGFKQWAAGLASAATDPQKQAEIWKIQQTVPVDIANTKATTNKTNVEAGLAPFIAQSGRISSNAAASNAQTASLTRQFGTASVVQNPITGESTRLLPGNAQTPGGFGVPVVDTTGQPVATGPTMMDSEVMKANAPRFAKAADDINTYTKVMQTLPLLKATLQSGYTGPLVGSDTGKQALAILSTIPGIGNIVDMNKLANAKAADAIQGELIGNLIKEISTRGSNMATKVVLARKPGTENTIESNLAMIDALGVDSQNGIAQAKGLLDYAHANPRDLTLSGYKAPTPQLPDFLKNAQQQGGPQKSATMPDPATLPDGALVTNNDTGQKLKVVSGRYQIVNAAQ